MKTLLLSVAVFAGLVSANAQQFNNGSFETWANGEPTEWFTTNFILTQLGIPGNVSQVNDATHGNSAAKLETAEISFGGMTEYFPAFVTSSMPISSKPVSVKGHYKWNIVDNDSASIIVTANKNGTEIGMGQKYLKGNSTNFQELYVEINYFTNEIPDTLFYILSTSSADSVTESGTYVIIDDIQATSTFTSTKEISKKETVSNVYPNPGVSEFSLMINLEKAATVNSVLFDATGKIVAENLFNASLSSGQNQVRFNISQLPSGLYFLQLKENGSVFASKKVYKR